MNKEDLIKKYKDELKEINDRIKYSMDLGVSPGNDFTKRELVGKFISDLERLL